MQGGRGWGFVEKKGRLNFEFIVVGQENRKKAGEKKKRRYIRSFGNDVVGQRGAAVRWTFRDRRGHSVAPGRGKGGSSCYRKERLVADQQLS